MMLLATLKRTLSRTSRPMRRLLDVFLAGLLGVMILDVLLGVGSRYLYGAQVEWTEELACYLLIWVGLVGAAAAFAKKTHLGLDVLVSHFAEPARRKARLISCGVCLFFTLLVFVIGGLALTIQAFQINRISPALRLPDGFLYLALPVSGVFMLVFQLEELLDTLLGGPETEPSARDSLTKEPPP